MSSSNSDTMAEKDLENGTHVDYGGNGSNGASLQQIPTNYTITNEQFERLYLTPRNQPVAGNLRKTFANPTVLGVAGFTVGLTPLSAQLLGWRGMQCHDRVKLAGVACLRWFKRTCMLTEELFAGAGGGAGDASATVGATIWFGGVCLLIAGILEFFLGNSMFFDECLQVKEKSTKGTD